MRRNEITVLWMAAYGMSSAVAVYAGGLVGFAAMILAILAGFIAARRILNP